MATLEAALGWPSSSTLVARLRISGSALQRARVEGLSLYQADRFAIRAGVHPAEVWPDWRTAA